MLSVSRRLFLTSSAALGVSACSTSLSAQTGAETAERADRFLVDLDRQPDDIFPIWNGDAPGLSDVDLEEHFVSRDNAFGLPDRAANDVTRPTLSYFKAARSNGNTILIIPGGAYHHVVVEKEGWETARYFNQFGYDAYVLIYRLPFQGWPAGPDAPLQDAQRAMRMIRARAADDSRVMVLGYSAGGHLAGSLAQKFDEDVYDYLDDVDDLRARPDLTVLGYPVTLMNSEFTHTGSRLYLLGEDPSPQQKTAYDLTSAVNPDSPPLFLFHALDDGSVVVENSVELMMAYRNAGLPAVLHVFEKGGHGFGMRGIDDTPLDAWPGLVMSYAQSHGFSAPDL